MPDVTFAVADLHGRDDLLAQALATIDRRAATLTPGTRTVVFLGDYVDRGPGSCAILERLVGGPPEGWRWICLKGNHEAMMALALRNPDRLDWWIADNGGDATVASYRDKRDAIAEHLVWIDALPSMHTDAHRIYVHAGLDPTKPLAHQQDKVLLWKRYPPEATEGFGAQHVVHGHHPNPDGPLLFAGRTALDTYAWATGRLVVALFDDALAGGPIETIPVVSYPLKGGRGATA